MIPRTRRAAQSSGKRSGSFQMVAVGALNLERIANGWQASREYRIPYDSEKVVLVCYFPHPMLGYARNTTPLWPRPPRLQLDVEPLPDEPSLTRFTQGGPPFEERFYPSSWPFDHAPLIDPINWTVSSFSYQESGHPQITVGPIDIDQAFGQPLWSTTHPLTPTARNQQTVSQAYSLEFYPIGPHRVALDLPYPIGTNRMRVRITLWEADLVRIGSLQKAASWGADPVPLKYRLFTEGRS